MSSTAKERVTEKPGKNETLATRLIGWQGILAHVLPDWDLTGFSGDDQSGYLRIDDGEDMALEVKWATEPGPRRKTETAKAPDVTVRRESYFHLLQKNAKKNKLKLVTRDADAPRYVLRPERTATGFTWTADRKATGAVWHCSKCRRTVIAQVLGNVSTRANFGTISEAVLGSLRCHNDDPDWQVWALYDLQTQVPSKYRLVSQELMNVYLRLTFADKTARLSVEQWSLANVARKSSYLDIWAQANTKAAEMNSARYTVAEAAINGHDAIEMTGGLKYGLPMVQAVREASRLQLPATRFQGVAWECQTANKLFVISQLRPARREALAVQVAEKTRCHEGDQPAEASRNKE